MSVRICAEDGPAAIWDDAGLECALARDLILASGGLPGETNGPALIARFDSVASAARAARRLQWSAQGLSDTSHPYTLSILIQAGDEVTREGFESQQLEHSAGGSILVTDAAARLLEEAPGFAVRRQGKGAGLREVAWRAAESLTTREADERTLARMIEQNGRPTEAPATQIAPAPDSAVLPDAWPEPEPRPASRTWLWIGLAAVLVAGAAASFYFFHLGTEQKVASVAPAQQTPAPAASMPASAPTTPVPAATVSDKTAPAPAPALTRAQKREEQRKEKAQAAAAALAAKANAHTSPPVSPSPRTDTSKPEVSGSCKAGYGPDESPHMLEMAEQKRERKDYKGALGTILRVLDCDRGNSKARDLLLKVQNDQNAAEGSSSPQ
ncbi:MAG: hypothetical protein WBX09_02605 [Terracidiphilus sp.]